MIGQRCHVLAFVIIFSLQVLSMLLFMHGLFPIPSPQEPFTAASFQPLVDACSSSPPPSDSSETRRRRRRIDRLALVVIDALRADFVVNYPGADSTLPKIRYVVDRLADGSAQGYVAMSQTPTVTMPRIKALTSGSVPAFIDVLFNFGSSAALGDHLPSQFSDAGLRTHFYGDDTWLRLFPNAFAESDGTRSFNVNDYTEVDENVTRHLHRQLSKSAKWDVLILHYLGLDHIGHFAGPRSELMPAKLDEMGLVIERLHEYFRRQGGRNVLLIVGDHGMTASGSHGGNSLAELRTGLIAILVGGSTTGGGGGTQSVNQVDLAPTIAALLGLPIPADSVGMTILPLLSPFFDNSALTREACVNARQLVRLYGRAFPENGEWMAHQVNSSRGSREELQAFARQMSADLSQAFADYDIHSIGFGIVLFACTTLALIAISQPFTWPHGMFAICFQAGTYFASSYVEEEHRLVFYVCALIHVGLLLRSRNESVKHVLQSVIGMILFRLATRWNSVGDAWSSEPDIADYLTGHPLLLSLVYPLALLALLVVRRNSEKRAVLFNAFALACVYAFRLSDGSMSWLTLPSSIGTGVALVVYVLVIGRICRAIHGRKSWQLVDSWLILSALLERPVDVPLLPLAIIIERLIGAHLQNVDNCFSAWAYGSCHGMALYFCMGHSNSLSSIDVFSGFIGVPHFAPLAINGILIALNTMIGPVLGMLLWLQRVQQIQEGRTTRREAEAKTSPHGIVGTLVAQCCRLTTACVAVTVFRFHIFVWSVFSPKALFEIAFLFAHWVLALIALPFVSPYKR